jgi:hypothetical protein
LVISKSLSSAGRQYGRVSVMWIIEWACLSSSLRPGFVTPWPLYVLIGLLA